MHVPLLSIRRLICQPSPALFGQCIYFYLSDHKRTMNCMAGDYFLPHTVHGSFAIGYPHALYALLSIAFRSHMAIRHILILFFIHTILIDCNCQTFDVQWLYKMFIHTGFTASSAILYKSICSHSKDWNC